jgi:hypothetical protein
MRRFSRPHRNPLLAGTTTGVALVEIYELP